MSSFIVHKLNKNIYCYIYYREKVAEKHAKSSESGNKEDTIITGHIIQKNDDASRVKKTRSKRYANDHSKKNKGDSKKHSLRARDEVFYESSRDENVNDPDDE